jgi:hypothetical protein
MIYRINDLEKTFWILRYLYDRKYRQNITSESKTVGRTCVLHHRLLDFSLLYPLLLKKCSSIFLFHIDNQLTFLASFRIVRLNYVVQCKKILFVQFMDINRNITIYVTTISPDSNHLLSDSIKKENAKFLSSIYQRQKKCFNQRLLNQINDYSLQ